MKKILVSLIFVCCSLFLLGQHKTDSCTLKHYKIIVDEINAMTLHKLWFIYDSESQSMKWDYVASGFSDSYGVAYLDIAGRVRKYIYNLSEEDNSRNIMCYYNEKGQLIFFTGKNSTTSSGRYNVQDLSENAVICSNGKKVIFQNIKRSFRKNGDEEFQTQRNICSKCKFPTYLGEMNIQFFTSTASLKKHFGLNTKTIDWGNCTMVTFGTINDSTVSWTMVNQNDVKIFSQPSIESEVLSIIDAGCSVATYPQQPIKQIENGICTMWYQVNFNGQDYGYIDSKFLEPIEKEVKELMMKFWSLMLVCLCCITHIYSQNCGIEEKKTINNIILHKVWSQNTKEGMILISNNPKHADGEVCYYFDSNENLRKIISWSKYPESLGVIIAYYNEEGELMYLIFSDFQPEGYSCQGIAYKTYRGTYNDSIELNYKVQYEATDFENIYVQGNAGKYPIKIGDLWLSQYTHIDSLKFYMKIETLQPPPNCKKVQFYKPSKNQITFTNSHGINFREGANASSKIIRTMVPGEIVKILDVLQEETVKHVGTYNWYKVLVNNKECYIFGAFLEPVEKEVRK